MRSRCLKLFGKRINFTFMQKYSLDYIGWSTLQILQTSAYHNHFPNSQIPTTDASKQGIRVICRIAKRPWPTYTPLPFSHNLTPDVLHLLTSSQNPWDSCPCQLHTQALKLWNAALTPTLVILVCAKSWCLLQFISI